MAGKINATGTCFVDSYHTIMEMNNPEARLVHGIVWGEGVGYHVHGWVELGDFCFDKLDGKTFSIPKERYYQLGKIKTGKGEIFKYTRQEAINKSLKTGQYFFSKLPCKK